MMERKKLMALDGLAPTSEMFRLAEQDILKKRTEFDTTHATNIIKLLGTLPDEKEILLEKIKNNTMKKLKDDKK